MESNHNLPYGELSGQHKLNGIYKVSFNIEVESDDELSLSDLAQSLTEGFGEGLLGKMAHLSFEKLDKTGQSISKILKVGDRVQLTKPISINASVYEDDGYVFVGMPTDISNEIGEQEIILEAGSIGYVNQIDEDRIEIVDIDLPGVIKTAEYTEPISVDLISLNIEMVEKIHNEEDK